MIKLAALAASAALIAAPAFAMKMTIEFKPDEGDTVLVVLDDATGMATIGDVSVPYTYDEATRTLCGENEDGSKMCATFATASEQPAVGDTSAYTAHDGMTGTATIKAIED